MTTTPAGGAQSQPQQVSTAAASPHEQQLDLPRDPRIAHPQHPAPRIVVYHQTHYHAGTNFISLLPLLTERPMAVTHVILAAVHLNDDPEHVTLNDERYDAPRTARVWAEARTLQQRGIKVMAMVGGAAQGSYRRLDQRAAIDFERYYGPLRRMLAWSGVDGVDLDVEEHMSLAGIVRLILRLRRDFGPAFIITLAPVATALQERPSSGELSAQRVVDILATAGRRTNLSGFSYADLEKAVGHEIDWYNAQFYCGWGSAEDPSGYERIVTADGGGWPAARVVLGLITNPEAGQGWVDDETLYETLLLLTARHPTFAGVMGWEYFGSMTAAEPYGWAWSWARLMTRILRPDVEEEQGEGDAGQVAATRTEKEGEQGAPKKG